MKKTDLIRVDRRFAEELRTLSKQTGETMINLTAQIPLQTPKKKRDPRDPFGLTVL